MSFNPIKKENKHKKTKTKTKKKNRFFLIPADLCT